MVIHARHGFESGAAQVAARLFSRAVDAIHVTPHHRLCPEKLVALRAGNVRQPRQMVFADVALHNRFHRRGHVAVGAAKYLSFVNINSV